MQNKDETIYLGNYIFPIVYVKHNEKDKEINVVDLYGTGFFIGNKGFFLTAKHVLSEELFNSTSSPSYFLAFLRKRVDNKSTWVPYQIKAVENAPSNIDVSIGKIDYEPNPMFKLYDGVNPGGWENIRSFGYPDFFKHSTFKPFTSFNFNNIFLKGYIVRIILDGETIGTMKNCNSGYLLSYPIPAKMSGSPIIIGDKFLGEEKLVGICLGSFDYKAQLYETIHYSDEISKSSETTNRIIEYGIGGSLITLKDWAIKLSGNKTLKEVVDCQA